MVETMDEGTSWKGLEELRGLLRCLLARHCTDQNEVEDVIHETYLRAFRYRKNLSEGGRLRSWATRIALNVLSDRKRRVGRQVAFTGEPAPEIPVPVESAAGDAVFRLGRFEVDRDQALRVLGQAWRGLRIDDQRVLGSFYHGVQSCRVTAQECDIPPHLVKVRLFRARKRLQRAVRRHLALDVA